MPFLSIAALIAVLLLVFPVAPSHAAGFVDAGERYVNVPDRVGRVMTASPAADVLVFVLAPDKLLGWSAPLSRGQRAYLPAKFARLPITGPLIRPDPTATAQLVARMHPDLIIECGPVSPEAAARADLVQQQTKIPYILLDNSIQATPDTLRAIGAMLGVGPRGEDLAKFADYAIDAVRGRLLIAPADERPLVYYGRGPDGLDTGLAGSQAMAAIDQAGVINVAAGPGPGELTRVTREQIIAWTPAIVIAEDRSFYNALMRGAGWRGMTAVANKHVYLAPADPFGWIDDPPGVNRLIGLYWLTALFYPDQYQEDLRANVSEFYDKFYGVKLSDRQLAALLRPAGIAAPATGSQVGVPLIGGHEPVPLPNPNAPPTAPPSARPPGRGGLSVPPPNQPSAPQ
ncbi:MAG TPA: ABC transporter substrate-binding protein [Stellaceae bacterium]|nr:ABC transporter substrate-binding protein [Stellaceae bacterium]